MRTRVAIILCLMGLLGAAPKPPTRPASKPATTQALAPEVVEIVEILSKPNQPPDEWVLAYGKLASLKKELRPAAVGALVPLLKDKSDSVRLQTAMIMGDALHGDAAAAVPALMEMLKSARGTDAECATQALGDIGPGASAAVPLLIEFTRKGNSTGAIALGHIGDARALPLLRMLARNGDPAAIQGLQLIEKARAASQPTSAPASKPTSKPVVKPPYKKP